MSNKTIWSDAHCNDFGSSNQPQATDDRVKEQQWHIEYEPNGIATLQRGHTIVAKGSSQMLHSIADAHNAALATDREKHEAELALVSETNNAILKESNRQLAAEREKHDVIQRQCEELHGRARRAEQSLLQAQAAIAEINRLLTEVDCDTDDKDEVEVLLSWLDESVKSIDLSALDKHDAELKSKWIYEELRGYQEAWNKDCAEQVRKPLVDALERAIAWFHRSAPAYECMGQAEKILADALAKVKP